MGSSEKVEIQLDFFKKLGRILIHGKEQESIWKSMSEKYVPYEGENVAGMLHMGMDGFEYPYPSAGTSQRRFRVD